MKKQFLAIALLCAVAALAGCSEQAMDTPEVPQQSQQALEVNATIVPYQAEEGTRTAISADGKVNWVDGDSLYVCYLIRDPNGGEPHRIPYLFKQGKFVVFNNYSNPVIKGTEDYHFFAINHMFWEASFQFQNQFLFALNSDNVLTSAELRYPLKLVDLLIDDSYPGKSLGERDLLSGYFKVSPGITHGAIDVPMKHLLTLMEFRIKNKLDKPFAVKSLTIETPNDVHIAGSLQPKYLRSSEGNFVLDTQSTYHRDGVDGWTEENIHKVSVINVDQVNKDGIYTIRTLLKPFELAAGNQVKISLNTTAGTFSKTYTIKAKHKFGAARISRTAVEVTSDCFTDVNLDDLPIENETLRQLLDKNKDNKVSKAEAEAAESVDLNFYRKSCTSLAGIEYLVNLKHLRIAKANNLTILDLAANTKLKTVTIIGNESLTTLNVKGLSSLKSLKFIVDENHNRVGSYPLMSLDLTGCTDLETLMCPANCLNSVKLEGLNKLKNLNLNNNLLESIDLTDCTALEQVDFSMNEFKSLSLENMPNLTDVNLYENRLLGTLSLAGSLNIVNLDLGRTFALKTLDLSSLTKLQTLLLCSDEVTTLDFSDCTNLQTLDLNFCQKLNSLDFSGCSKLKTIEVSNCCLTSLNLTGCSALSNLIASDNNLTKLDVSTCSPDLGKDRNNLLDLISNPNLTTLYVRPGFDSNAPGVNLNYGVTITEKEPAAQP